MSINPYLSPARIHLPSPLFALNSPEALRARQYLIGRGFDPDELATIWGLSYCPVSTSPAPAFQDRIVIPITKVPPFGMGDPTEESLVGWQARVITEGVEPKYLFATGTKKSHVLYGLPSARKCEGPVILVEGPTDVWRFGSNAVAFFGKSVSAAQLLLLLSNFRGRPLVFIFDRDADAKCRKYQTQLLQTRRQWQDFAPVLIGQLPEGREDIGECTRQEAWDTVTKALHSVAAG
jgi:DNA primase